MDRNQQTKHSQDSQHLKTTFSKREARDVVVGKCFMLYMAAAAGVSDIPESVCESLLSQTASITGMN